MAKNLDEIRRILKEQKPYLEEMYGVHIVGLFGSYIRHEERPDSDIDLLVDLERPPRISLLGLVEIVFMVSQSSPSNTDRIPGLLPSPRRWPKRPGFVPAAHRRRQRYPVRWWQTGHIQPGH
jgi:predicted nucleotidyltransferase